MHFLMSTLAKILKRTYLNRLVEYFFSKKKGYLADVMSIAVYCGHKSLFCLWARVVQYSSNNETKDTGESLKIMHWFISFAAHNGSFILAFKERQPSCLSCKQLTVFRDCVTIFTRILNWPLAILTRQFTAEIMKFFSSVSKDKCVFFECESRVVMFGTSESWVVLHAML